MGGVALPVRAQRQHAHATLGQRLDQRGELRPALHGDELDAMGSTQSREIDVLRRRKITLERRIVLRDGLVFENTTATVVDQHDGQLTAQRRAKQQPVRIVQE